MPGILPQDNHRQVKMRAKREFREVWMWEPIQETQEAKPIIANTIYIWREGGFPKSRIVADHFPTIAATSPITHAFLELSPSPTKRWSLCPIPLNPGRSLWPPWQVRVCQKWHCGTDCWGCHAKVTQSALLSQDAHSKPRHHVLRKPKQVPMEKIQVAYPHPPIILYIKFPILS